MRNNLVNMTIADYVAALERKEILVDPSYQRSPQVWPTQAQSFLIETILMGYPIPKLALHQMTDLKSRRTTKYVVDGQQRTNAIRHFYQDVLRLGRNLEMSEAAGRTLSGLDENLQEAFLAYPLQFDQFEASTNENVRDYFRRINSFTAPLNAEEQRHARYQGAMKWLINSLASHHGSTFVSLNVLTQKNVIRMGDAKLLSELVHALVHGITTTTKAALNKLYADYERVDTVTDEAQIRKVIGEALDLVLAIPDIQDTALMKTNVFYSLMLAAILVQSNWRTLRPLSPVVGRTKLADAAEENLLTLAAALEDPEAFEEYEEFTEAASEKTNVKAQRETRVKWLALALSQDDMLA
jgi:hypothetical protein